jgi:hypothetical protein
MKEIDWDGVCEHLDGLDRGYSNEKMQFTEDQKRFLVESRINRKVPWADVMAYWESQGWRGHVATLQKWVLKKQKERE